MTQKALFLVNSLSNGGAERVCTNMANELLKQGFKVDFIVLNDHNKTYDIDNKINIYNLDINSNNRIIKLFQLFISIKKVNKIIKKNELDSKYNLITSHLPMSNFLTMLLKIRNQSIYVFHTKISSYDKKNSKLFYNVFRLLYHNKKIVAVSKGVRNEAIEKYKMNPKYIKTIYNPIDIDNIKNKSQEEIADIGKYILQVGRFNEAKRQDRMIEIFYKGNFFKEFKLVFCGTGELEDKIKEQVKSLNLEDKVLFLGWQQNVYKWIKNAEILVSTSDYEAFPMNLIEALACNTKIVTSNCKYGPEEIMLGEYKNYLVEPDNIKEYIKKINEALLNYPKEKNRILDKCQASNIINEYLKYSNKEGE